MIAATSFTLCSKFGWGPSRATRICSDAIVDSGMPANLAPELHRCEVDLLEGSSSDPSRPRLALLEEAKTLSRILLCSNAATAMGWSRESLTVAAEETVFADDTVFADHVAAEATIAATFLWAESSFKFARVSVISDAPVVPRRRRLP